MLTIYVLDAEGKRDRTVPSVIDGTLGDANAVFELLRYHLRRLGEHQAEELTLIGDRAKWIWTRAEGLRDDLGLAPERSRSRSATRDNPATRPKPGAGSSRCSINKVEGGRRLPPQAFKASARRPSAPPQDFQRYCTAVTSPRQPRRFYAENLGCGPAAVDLERNVGRLLGDGATRTDDPAVADILLIQTCSFLNSQAEMSVARVLELQATLAPGARIVALGCAIDTERTHFEAGVDDRVTLVGARESYLDGEAPITSRMQAAVGVRISRGCASQCAFCSIRLSQGNVASLNPAEVAEYVEEARRSDDDVIHLYSEDVGAWGLDRGQGLPDLLSHLHRTFPALRFRAEAISPQWFKLYQRALLDFIRAGILDRRIYCPAQSGSSSVLRAMRRGYDAAMVHDVYDALFTEVEGVELYTDFILGFPGETAADVEETALLAERYPYWDTRIWAMETRPGTRAATLAQQVPAQERERRARLVAMRYLRARWARDGLTPAEATRRFLRGQLPVRSNVALFEAGSLNP